MYEQQPFLSKWCNTDLPEMRYTNGSEVILFIPAKFAHSSFGQNVRNAAGLLSVRPVKMKFKTGEYSAQHWSLS